MAVTITNVLASRDVFVADVVATADADVLATIPHGMSATPEEVWIAIPTGAKVIATAASRRLADYQIATVGATNITLDKTAAVGSGDLNAGVRVIAIKKRKQLSALNTAILGAVAAGSGNGS